jgi:sec-independent protein translocase protein TatC
MNREELFQGLANLRKGLLQMAVTVLLIGGCVYPFSKNLLRHFYEANLRSNLVAFSVPEVFFSLIKLTVYASLFLSIPVIFYQIWKSFSPFLRLKGMKSAFAVPLTAILLFYLGASFCYFVTLPFGIQFLLGYQTTRIKPMISVGKYISFFSAFIFGFGLTFELPLILALLSTIKVISAAFLTRNRRYAILLIAILSAVLTPTPDVFNMSLMGGPLYCLFEIGVILVKIIERKRAQSEVSQNG